MDPQDQANRQAVGEMCLDLGRPEVLARTLVTQAQERRDQVEAHSRRGLELVAAARLGLQQNDWDLVAETARLFASLGRQGEAKALLNQCLALDPGNRHVAQVLAQI